MNKQTGGFIFITEFDVSIIVFLKVMYLLCLYTYAKQIVTHNQKHVIT